MLIDRSYDEEVPDVTKALTTAGGWAEGQSEDRPIALGHGVVHGGPDYDRPVRVDPDVLARLERYVSLAPLHQPYNLAPIRSVLSRFPEIPQVACSTPRFIAATARLPTATRFRKRSKRKASGAMASTGFPTNISQARCRRWRRTLRPGG